MFLGVIPENNQTFLPILLQQRFRKLGAVMMIAYQAKTTQRLRMQRLRKQRLRKQRLRKQWSRLRIRIIS